MASTPRPGSPRFSLPPGSLPPHAPHPCGLCATLITGPTPHCPLCVAELEIEHQAKLRAEREARVAALIAAAELAAGMTGDAWGDR